MSNDDKKDGVVDDSRDIDSFINVNKQTNDSLNDFIKESRKDRKESNDFRKNSSKDAARYNRDALKEYLERNTRDDDEKMSRKKLHGQLDKISTSLEDLLKQDKAKKDSSFDFMKMLPLLTSAIIAGLAIAKPDEVKPYTTAAKSTMGLANAGQDAIKALSAAKALSASTGILGTIGKTLGKYSDSPMMKKVVRLTSGGMMAGRALEGDYVGATGEGASWAMHEAAAKANNPKTKAALTAASLGLDVGLIVRDVMRGKDATENEKLKANGEEPVDNNTIAKNVTQTATMVLPALAAFAVPLLMSKKFAVPDILGGKGAKINNITNVDPNANGGRKYNLTNPNGKTPNIKDLNVQRSGLSFADAGSSPKDQMVKGGAKAGAKAGLKLGAKAIPFLGMGLGLYGGATRAMDGDYKGAALEVVSGLASFIPVVGTAAAVAIQGGLMYRDAVNENKAKTEEINTISKDGVVSLNNAGVQNAEQSMIASDMMKESSGIVGENSKKMTADMETASSSYFDMTKTMSFGILSFTTNMGLKFADWVFGADNVFRTAADTMSKVSSNVLSTIANAAKGLFGFGGGASTKNASAPEADAHAKGSELHSTRKSNMVAVYDSFLKAGMSEAQAKAMTAEIGRENDFGNNLWKTHTDDKNGKKNVGMMSWQNGRDTKLLDYLGKEGVLNKDGTIQRTKEALDAQARFVMKELKGDYKRVGNKFLGEKDISYKDASKMLGKEYIGWAYDNEKYAGGHKRRDDHFANLNTELHKRDIKTPEKKVNYISKKDYAKITKAEPKPPMMASAELHDKWNKKEAERVKQYTKTQSGILDGSIKVGDAPKQSKSNTTIPYAAKSNDAKSSSSSSAPASSSSSNSAAAKASFDLDKICQFALTNAKFKSRSARAADKKTDYRCAEYVRKAIQAGDNTKKVGTLGHAREWGTTLPKIGWVPASGGLQKGDIAWFPKGVSGYGHVCVWTGKVWVSDFIQGDNPQPNSQMKLDYKTYRAKSGYTNGTAVGAEGAEGAAKGGDTTNAGNEGGEAAKEESVMERAQSALVTGIAGIGAALFDNQLARDAVNAFDGMKVDSYDKLDHKKDAVNMDGFDTKLREQDDKGFKYKFGENGVNRSTLFSKDIQRQKDTDTDYLQKAGDLGGVKRQLDSKYDYLDAAGSLGGIQRQKDAGFDYLDAAGNLGGIQRQEDVAYDYLGNAGSAGGIQKQGGATSSKKKLKWYDKLFGGKHSDIFGNMFDALGLGGLFDLGQGVYKADKDDDLLGFGLKQLDGVMAKSDQVGLGGIGKAYNFGRGAYDAHEKGDLLGFGLNQLTGLLTGTDVNGGVTYTDPSGMTGVSGISGTPSADLSNPVFTNTGMAGSSSLLAGLTGNGLNAGFSLENSPLNGISKLATGAMKAHESGDWLGFGLDTTLDLLTGKIVNPFAKKKPAELSAADIAETALVDELLKPTEDLTEAGLAPTLSGLPSATAESAIIAETNKAIAEDGIVPSEKDKYIPTGDLQRYMQGSGLGAAMFNKHEADTNKKNPRGTVIRNGVLVSIGDTKYNPDGTIKADEPLESATPSSPDLSVLKDTLSRDESFAFGGFGEEVKSKGLFGRASQKLSSIFGKNAESGNTLDLNPSAAASLLSPDHEGRSKIDGVISETNKQYNSIKNAPPPASGDGSSPVGGGGSGTTPHGSKSGVGDGLSSALVTRNPDSIFREVSITVMKATIT